MEKLIIGVILLMCGDKFLTTAMPQWVSNQETTIDISMVDDTACTGGIATIQAGSTSSQTITYSTNDETQFTVSLDLNTLLDKLYCDYSALQAQSNTELTTIVTATDPEGSITRTFTLTLIDQYAPVFGSNSVSFTNCDVSGYSIGDILHTVAVTDADPGDVVTVSITTSGTPFSVTENTKITFADASALTQFFTDSSFPYTLNIEAQDTDNKYSTSGSITIAHTSGQDCSGGGSNSDGSANNDGDNGNNVLSCSVYIVGFLLVIASLLHKL